MPGSRRWKTFRLPRAPWENGPIGANKILKEKLQGKKADVGITLIFLGEPDLFV